MCGIAGFTHRGSPPEPHRIRLVNQAMRHRGPDQQGEYHSNDISVGAVRLRIIDLAGGDQPIVSEDGHTAVAFNGEIYNHDEIRRQLESLGWRFRSRCDTEVALNAFLQWDMECLRRFRGMFAVAFWRQAERRLLLARDRMGIKPLYYCVQRDEIYFGSELKALFEHPEIGRRLNLAGLNYYLSLNYVPGPHTLVEDIVKLQPGHWLEWRDGRVTVGRWWNLRFAPAFRGGVDDAAAELDLLLRESVREHLLSDVPLGVWSSGGIDSTTILHYAADLSPSRLKTFSISFRGRRFDESRWFREVSRRYGTEHHEMDLNPETDLAGAIQAMAWYSDEPSADAGALPVWFVSQLSRRHVTVALTGDGADEILGGYTTYLADGYAGLLRRVPRSLRRAMLGAAAFVPVSDDKIGFEYKLKRFLAGSLLPADVAHLFWNGTFSESEKGSLLEAALPAVPPLAAALAAGQGEVGLVNQFLWLDQIYYLPDDILYKCDRMSMAHSLEARPPFLDHRLVEFAASLPQNYKVRGTTLKYVLRRLMRDKLPPSVLKRPKEGFDIPTHDWFRGPLFPLLRDTLNETAVRDTGLFSWTAVDSIIRSHTERRRNLGYHLWGLLTLFLWMKQWKIAPAGEAVPEIASRGAGATLAGGDDGQGRGLIRYRSVPD